MSTSSQLWFCIFFFSVYLAQFPPQSISPQSFVIPVNVRVTDVNDNAPQWIGTPYTLTLSEVTVPGTRILQGARAEDADQPGPFSTVEYQVLPGPYWSTCSFSILWKARWC